MGHRWVQVRYHPRLIESWGGHDDYLRCPDCGQETTRRELARLMDCSGKQDELW